MATGGGHANLNEAAAALDIPGMSKNTFISIEAQIREAWEAQLVKEIVKAGKEEREIAVSKNKLFEGVPAISVTVDGGWSKRSHKHSYNAKSGVAVIIGNATKKLLYLGNIARFVPWHRTRVHSRINTNVSRTGKGHKDKRKKARYVGVI